jgi:hypothetical protein
MNPSIVAEMICRIMMSFLDIWSNEILCIKAVFPQTLPERQRKRWKGIVLQNGHLGLPGDSKTRKLRAWWGDD